KTLLPLLHTVTCSRTDSRRETVSSTSLGTTVRRHGSVPAVRSILILSRLAPNRASIQEADSGACTATCKAGPGDVLVNIARSARRQDHGTPGAPAAIRLWRSKKGIS